MKRYNLRCNYCGTDHHVLRFLFYLKLLVLGDVDVVCSNCGYVSNYILVSHIVHDTTNMREKEFNKHFDKAKKDIQRNG